MKQTSNFIESLYFILKRHLNSNEKLRTVSIIFDTELKKDYDKKSSLQIPVVFSKVPTQISSLKSPELFAQPLNTSAIEPHPATSEINPNGKHRRNPINNPLRELEPQFETILSIREKEIIGALAQGYNHKMIADKLGISVNTVRNHFRSIHFKLCVHSNTQVLLKVLKNGVLKTKLSLFLYYSAMSSLWIEANLLMV